MSHKISSIAFVFLAAAFVSCGKSHASYENKGEPAPNPTVLTDSSSTQKELSAPEKESGTAKPVALNPEHQLLREVLDSMSDRFKGDIQIEDAQMDEFLFDLNRVLEAEKSFPKDDLSLYYLIDKKHKVGKDYVPKGLKPVKTNSYWNVSRNDLSLRPDVYEALKKLALGAKDDGITLMVSSTYRSYEYQTNLFNRYVRQDGEAEADRYSARPGTSQHQLGVAIDFGSIDDAFAETKMGKWLNEHSEEYGWSLSFPKEYEDVTGFMWECWHFRYIGEDACLFQNKWFCDVQQYMIEFIDAWKTKKGIDKSRDQKIAFAEAPAKLEEPEPKEAEVKEEPTLAKSDETVSAQSTEIAYEKAGEEKLPAPVVPSSTGEYVEEDDDLGEVVE